MPRAGRPTAAGRPPPGRELGLLWGAVAAALVAVSPLAPGVAAALPACAFRGLTGLPCAGCGATRTALALARLDVAEALACNPLAAIGTLAFVGGGLLAGALALAGRPLREPDCRRLSSPLVRLLMVVLVLANWVYLVRAGV